MVQHPKEEAPASPTAVQNAGLEPAAPCTCHAHPAARSAWQAVGANANTQESGWLPSTPQQRRLHGWHPVVDFDARVPGWASQHHMLPPGQRWPGAEGRHQVGGSGARPAPAAPARGCLQASWAAVAARNAFRAAHPLGGACGTVPARPTHRGPCVMRLMVTDSRGLPVILCQTQCCGGTDS